MRGNSTGPGRQGRQVRGPGLILSRVPSPLDLHRYMSWEIRTPRVPPRDAAARARHVHTVRVASMTRPSAGAGGGGVVCICGIVLGGRRCWRHHNVTAPCNSLATAADSHSAIQMVCVVGSKRDVALACPPIAGVEAARRAGRA